MRAAAVWPVLLALVLLAGGCGSDDRALPTIRTELEFRKDGELAFLTAGGDTITTIDVEIAETDETRARGLMGRRGLPPRSGMLFIMDSADTTGFWMRNTPLPLDIIFVNPDFQVINIAKRTTPFSDDLISPEAPKLYVVEVRAGFTDLAGITEDSRISFTRVP